MNGGGWRQRRGARATALAVLCAAGLAAACESPTVPSRDSLRPYNFSLDSSFGPLVLRWPAGSVVTVYPVVSDDTVRARVLREGLEHGRSVWNQAALYNEFRIEVAPTVEDADVVLGWSNTVLPVATAGCEPGGGGAAVTTFCLADPSHPERLRPFPIRTPDGLQNGRPRMLVLLRSDEVANPALVRRIVAHELGHTLGIGRHSPDQADLMWGGVITADGPSLSDRATLRILYQTRPDIQP